MKKLFQLCLVLILCLLMFQGIRPSLAADITAWQTILTKGVDEIPEAGAMLASATRNPSFELWHYSGGYWGTTIEGQKIRIYDNDQFDDPDYIASQINQPVTFRMELPAEVKQAVVKGTPLKVVCEAPSNLVIQDLFYFNKGNPQFRIVDGDEIEFKAYPKLNFVSQVISKYINFVPDLDKYIPIVKQPYGKNVYAIYTKGGNKLGMGSGYFDANDPAKLGPEGTIHPSQIANSNGDLKPGFKVKVEDKLYNSADVKIGSSTFKNAGAVGIHFEYPITLKFYAAADDLSAQFEAIPATSPAGEDTTVAVRVNSTFNKEVESQFQWDIKTADGTVVDAVYFEGHGTTASGKVTIPANGEQLFYATFKMPDSSVQVDFRINNQAGTEPKEEIVQNNLAQGIIRLGRSYVLPYNVLSRDIVHPLINGEDIDARLRLPRGEWDGNAKGRLNVVKSIYPEMYSEEEVQNNPEVNEPSAHIIRNPQVAATVKRSAVGDVPEEHEWINLDNPWTPMLRNPGIDYEGSVSRRYEYYCDDDECSVKHHATAHADFDSGVDLAAMKIYIYNGKRPEDMPDVPARDFKQVVENNYYSENTRKLFWISDPYDLDVIRWMCRLDTEGNEYDYQEIDGQYQRIFTQQNTADITYKSENTMAAMYQYDRENAYGAKAGKQYYPRVPFATDRELQRYGYPFKSGYYFNPAGTYTFTIKSVQYKDSTARTEEHRQLVDKVIDAFHYQSDLQYTNDGRTTYNIDLTAANPTINGLQMLDIKQDYDKATFELPHTTASSGYTHDYFKEILEGYSESNTRGSLDNFKYREYVKDGQHIYKVVEETKVTVTVNPANHKVYTWAQMPDGAYQVRAWLEDVNLTNYRYDGLYVKGKAQDVPLDEIVVTVKGSMYEDLDN